MAKRRDLITMSQAAEILDLSVSTVYYHMLRGRLPVALKLPGTTGPYLFRRTDVEALLPTTDNGDAA